MHVTSKGLRDLFFLMVGSAILYHEFWQEQDPSPLGVFVALFLFGLIPAFRADEGSTVGPLGVLLTLLTALGAKEPRVPPGLAEEEARVERAEREVREAQAREAARAAQADREGQEDRNREPDSP